MRFAYLCSDIDIEMYGNEGCSVHIRQFTDALIEMGHEAFIACHWLGDDAAAAPKAPVYEIAPRRLDALAWRALAEEPVIIDHHLERDLQSVVFNAWAKERLREIMLRERPDAIYERYALFGWAGVDLAADLRLPLILEVNSPLCIEQDGYEKFTLTATAARIERGIFEAADAIVAVSRWLKDWIVSLGIDGAKVHVIPNAVNDRLFRIETTGDSIRRELGLEDRRVVGFVGSFHHWHDVGGLIDAFEHLYREDPDLRLLLIGAGQERSRLEQKTREHGLTDVVVFAGHVPHERLPAHLAAMDVAVAPYRRLNSFFFSPLKLFEYMAMARPTVAADIGQIGEIAVHGETGWLYPPGDHEGLISAIGTALYDRPRARSAAAAAREYVLQRHTWRSVVGEVVDLAARLRDRPNRP